MRILHRITPEQVSTLADRGLSTREIARTLDCSQSTVCCRLKGKYPKPSAIESRIADIVAMRMDRKSYREIGEKYGVTRERIRQILVAGGYEWLTGHGWVEEYRKPPLNGGRKVTDEALAKVEAIRELRAAKRTYREIGAALGISRSAVAGLIYRHSRR